LADEPARTPAKINPATRYVLRIVITALQWINGSRWVLAKNHRAADGA
jgi:hypothetical protein